MATKGAVPDEELLGGLIEAITEPGREAAIWQKHFSWGQRLEIWLHRFLCTACRKNYPLWRKSQWGLWQDLALKRDIKERENAGRATINAAATRQLQGLIADIWSGLVASRSKEDLTEGQELACFDLTHLMWDAYLRHIHQTK